MAVISFKRLVNICFGIFVWLFTLKYSCGGTSEKRKVENI